MAIQANIEKIEQRILRACEWSRRERSTVTMVVAGKYASVDELWQVKAAGVTDIGENQVQAARDKKPHLSGFKWHMIGHLQTNKVKQALELFDLIHSVDSLRLAEEISKQANRKRMQVDILLEVNIAGEESKYGFTPPEIGTALGTIQRLPGCRVQGLMCMVPYSDQPEDSRVHYRNLRILRDELQDSCQIMLPHLSMGMTQDFEVAIDEGASMVRIGRAIFSD